MSAFQREKHHVISCFSPLVLLRLRHWKVTRVCMHLRGKLARAQQAEASGKWDGEYFIPANEEGGVPTSVLSVKPYVLFTANRCHKSYLKKSKY